MNDRHEETREVIQRWRDFTARCGAANCGIGSRGDRAVWRRLHALVESA